MNAGCPCAGEPYLAAVVGRELVIIAEIKLALLAGLRISWLEQLSTETTSRGARSATGRIARACLHLEAGHLGNASFGGIAFPRRPSLARPNQLLAV